MTENEKKMKKYMNAVERRLNLPFDVKVRVMNDLSSSIAARREAGKSDEEIYAELGTPKQVAAELNEQMKEYALKKSPLRWACLAAAVLGGLLLAFDGVVGLLAWLVTKSINSTSVGIIGGADGPTAIFVASPPNSTGTLLWLTLLVLGLLGYWYLSRGSKK